MSHFQCWCIKCLVCQCSLFCRTMGRVWRHPRAPVIYATHSLGLAVFVTGYCSSRRVWGDEVMFNTSTMIPMTRDNIFIIILYYLEERGLTWACIMYEEMSGWLSSTLQQIKSIIALDICGITVWTCTGFQTAGLCSIWEEGEIP